MAIPLVVAAGALSVLSYAVTWDLIPLVARRTLAHGLFGRDLNKSPFLSTSSSSSSAHVPESLGIVPATVFLAAAALLQLTLFLPFEPHREQRLAEFNAALTSVGFMVLLGFADDVLDLPWRVKLILPLAASIPLVVAYSGSTFVVVPIPFRAYLGQVVNLGILYHAYMILLAVFCTNSINIYAGINGLEVGQSMVIGISVAVHNFIEYTFASPGDSIASNHAFSLGFMLLFLSTSYALLRYNWYPSQVFVGDTFTYFSGITFAVVGILGHFSKTLLLFFIPQILNFLYSLPQLLGFIPCPRHRLPQYNESTDKLEGKPENWNLVNGALRILGPMHERTLCIILLGFQVFCSLVAFWIRYHLSTWFY